MDDDYYLSSDEDCNYQDDDDFDDQDGFDGLLDIDDGINRINQTGAKVITKESLLAAQREDLHRVMDMLSLREHHARTLLIHYCWDVEKVFTVLVENGKDKLYAEAGVTEVDHNNLSLPQFTVVCDICTEEASPDVVTTMDCGHYFCNNCWTEYFVVKINDGQSRRIRCMAYKCNAICDEAKVRNLVSARDADLAEKFERFLLESYIEDNRRVKWCPSVPHCGNAIHVEDDDFREVECACGLQFCFICLYETHSPCSCLMWEYWAKKCQDESMTVKWITVHTKPCPKCHKPVEKNGGCNHVHCLCGQSFCWLCGSSTGRPHSWTAIDGHSCGRYAEEELKKTESAKSDLKRYTHYHNRYKAHYDSSKLESELSDTIKEKIKTLEEREEKESAFVDCSWIVNGLHRLFRSRQVISYSYPFAYYMFGDLFKDEMTKEERIMKQNLFEDQQQQLEEHVEKLSMIINEPFHTYSADKVSETRMKIINLSLLVDDLCKSLYECIENDLLGRLPRASHTIAPYNSKGVGKASELSVCCNAEA